MQRKLYLGSFGIQKSIENWNPKIPGINTQNHTNWALSLYELYGTNKYAWKHFLRPPGFNPEKFTYLDNFAPGILMRPDSLICNSGTSNGFKIYYCAYKN